MYGQSPEYIEDLESYIFDHNSYKVTAHALTYTVTTLYAYIGPFIVSKPIYNNYFTEI